MIPGKIILTLFALMAACTGHAQESNRRAAQGKHRVVFEVTMAGRSNGAAPLITRGTSVRPSGPHGSDADRALARVSDYS